MESEKVFIGVDGGGTKTRTVVTNLKGDILGDVLSDCTNWNSIGRDAAFINLKQGLEGALTAAKTTKEQVASICLGMAGINTPAHEKELEQSVLKIIPNSTMKIHICNDAVTALVSGTLKLHGMVVISGTGSITLGVNEGKHYRVGGWGPILGDEGSGFSLGQSILRAVCRAEDEGTHTLLTRFVLEELKLASVNNLIEWTYSEEKLSWARFAKLSQLLYNAVEQGDEIAKKVLKKNAEDIVEIIQICYKKAKFVGRVPLVFSGGNLTHKEGNGPFALQLKQLIEKNLPDVDVVLPSVNPAEAAAILAREEENTKK